MGDGTVKNRLANTDSDTAGYQRQLSLAYGGTNATYDAEGRLVQVSFGGVVATYDYDAEGRRVKRTDASGAATYYIYDAAGQLMAEYGGTATGSGTQYIATDHLGSTRMVQDAQGNCAVRMDYAPHGAVVSRSGQDCYGAPWTSGRMFTGALRDGDSELDHMEARQYWATLGRFTSSDPDNAGSYPDDAQSWNGYSYGRSNPLRYSDPDGLNYWVCDTQGHCEEWTDEQWNKWREAQGGSIIYTPGGNILIRETEKKIGSAQYYDPSGLEALKEAAIRVDILIKDAAKQMAVGAVIGGVGGALLGRFAPQLIDFAASRLPVTKVFPALSRLSPKILRQMQTRGWTRAQIQEAFERGQQFPAVNRLRGGTSATRYVHPLTGKAVTIDNATGEVIQVGGSGFTYTHY